jgi:microcystin-dependent protein
MCYEPYIGEIMLWAGNYAPEGWAFCDGSLVPINQNVALFSLLGTTYGGNGTTTFCLPDLRGRVAVGRGQGLNLTYRNVGDVGGAEASTVNMGTSQQVTQADTGTAATVAAAPTQASVQLDNMQPFLTLTYVIALQGYWPSRQ